MCLCPAHCDATEMLHARKRWSGYGSTSTPGAFIRSSNWFLMPLASLPVMALVNAVLCAPPLSKTSRDCGLAPDLTSLRPDQPTGNDQRHNGYGNSC